MDMHINKYVCVLKYMYTMEIKMTYIFEMEEVLTNSSLPLLISLLI
jgi:hypothetical protein